VRTASSPSLERPSSEGDGDVAMGRLPPAVKTPAEFVTFRVEEWVAPDDEGSKGVRFGVGRLRGTRGWKRIRAHSW
jgi:hypothetical protein